MALLTTLEIPVIFWLFRIKPNTDNLKKGFSYRGAKLWNSLPQKLKAEQSIEFFRKSLRSLGLLSFS